MNVYFQVGSGGLAGSLRSSLSAGQCNSRWIKIERYKYVTYTINIETRLIIKKLLFERLC